MAPNNSTPPDVNIQGTQIISDVRDFIAPLATPFYTQVYGVTGKYGDHYEAFRIRPVNSKELINNNVSLPHHVTVYDTKIQYWDSPKDCRYSFSIYQTTKGKSIYENIFEINKINDFAYHLTARSQFIKHKKIGILIWVDGWNSVESNLDISDDPGDFK